MSHPAPARTTAPSRLSELVRFCLGIVASGVLVAAGTLLTLAVLPSMAPGWSTTAVGSGSMQPALATGDAVVVEEWSSQRPMLGPPSVVLIDRPGAQPLLHRVTALEGERYRTKGDANASADAELAPRESVIGVGRVVVPRAGFVALWVSDRNAPALLILAAVVTVLAWLSRFGWLERYDPWRAHPDPLQEQPSGPTPPEAATAPPGRRLPGARTPAPRRAPALTRVVLHGIVIAVLVVGMSRAGSSTSAFTASTDLAGTAQAARLSAPTNLVVTCSRRPAIVDAVAAGPTTPAPKLPASIRLGDTLLLSRTGIRPTDGLRRYVDPPTPTGWTQLGITVGGGERFHAIYRRTAQSEESAKTMPHTSAFADVLLVARGGIVVDSSLGGQVNETGSSVTVPSVTGNAGGLLLTFWAVERSNTRFSAPAGMSEVVKTAFTQTISMGAHEQQINADGPTGTRTSAMTDGTRGQSVSTRNSGLSLYIRSTAYATLTWQNPAASAASAYVVTRDRAPVATLDPSETIWRDPDPLTGRPTAFTLTGTAGTWRSPTVGLSTSVGTC